MAVIPIQLPPGFYKNGTPYAAKGRWADGDLVRWHDGSLRPIGGWERSKDLNSTDLPVLYADPDAEHCRDLISWRANDGDKIVVYGTNLQLHFQNAAGLVSPIPITGFPSDIPAAVGTADGYGTGPYGQETYGTPRSQGLSQINPVYRWNFDLWGENLLMCPMFYEYATADVLGLWEWAPNAASATLVANAPKDITGMVVTDQRIVMTIGSKADPRLVQWCSREDNTLWNEALDNEAGKFTLQGSGRLTSVHKVLNQILILSETDAHIARYTGAPYIYGFEGVGENCGSLHPAAVVVTGRFAIWPGRRNFFKYDGTLQPVGCDVIDYLVNNEEGFNPQLYSTMHGVAMREFNEVWWFYAPNSVSGAANASDITAAMRYVYYDYIRNEWGTGKLPRSASFNFDSADPPIMVDSTGAIFDHELEGVAVDGQPYAETGPIELGVGEANIAVRKIFPDTQTTGGVRYTLTGKKLPTAPNGKTRTYDGRNPVSTRVLGREVAMRVYLDSARQEVGPLTRFDVAPQGTGKR